MQTVIANRKRLVQIIISGHWPVIKAEVWFLNQIIKHKKKNIDAKHQRRSQIVGKE